MPNSPTYLYVNHWLGLYLLFGVLNYKTRIYEYALRISCNYNHVNQCFMSIHCVQLLHTSLFLAAYNCVNRRFAPLYSIIAYKVRELSEKT